MSLLERIKLIEGAIIDLSDNQKIFLEVLEEINGKLDRLLAKKVKKDWSLLEGASEQPTVIEKTIIKGGTTVQKEPTNKEEIDMDFKGVTVMNQTEKALLVVKKGYQQWLAKSLIQGGGTGYDNGNVYDVEIKEISPKSKKPTKWVYKKWEKFEVFKN